VIFVTVGTQIAFDRMVSVVDDWAARTGEKVFAQTGPSQRTFTHLDCKGFLEPADFDRYFNEASLIIAHAGMGSILSALSFGKPIIIMPRKAALGEHRNDHQMATAKRFAGQTGVSIAWDENELAALLDKADLTTTVGEAARISGSAPEAFLAKLRDLIDY
jgi:UDP-N-acetylglucosamine transferase subunit ALG13